MWALPFSASSTGVRDAILEALSKPDLTRAFVIETPKALQSGEDIGDLNAKHVALYEVITANCDRFPEEASSSMTDLGDGASIKTEVSAAGRKF